jgi:hypothetical protein
MSKTALEKWAQRRMPSMFKLLLVCLHPSQILSNSNQPKQFIQAESTVKSPITPNQEIPKKTESNGQKLDEVFD